LSLSLQTVLFDNEKKSITASSISPVKIDFMKPTLQSASEVTDSLAATLVALIGAAKKNTPLPADKNAEQVSTQILYMMYKAFESGEFAMKSCSRFPCEDGTNDHVLVLRFTPPT